MSVTPPGTASPAPVQRLVIFAGATESEAGSTESGTGATERAHKRPRTTEVSSLDQTILFNIAIDEALVFGLNPGLQEAIFDHLARVPEGYLPPDVTPAGETPAALSPATTPAAPPSLPDDLRSQVRFHLQQARSQKARWNSLANRLAELRGRLSDGSPEAVRAEYATTQNLAVTVTTEYRDNLEKALLCMKRRERQDLATQVASGRKPPDNRWISVAELTGRPKGSVKIEPGEPVVISGHGAPGRIESFSAGVLAAAVATIENIELASCIYVASCYSAIAPGQPHESLVAAIRRELKALNAISPPGLVLPAPPGLALPAPPGLALPAPPAGSRVPVIGSRGAMVRDVRALTGDLLYVTSPRIDSQTIHQIRLEAFRLNPGYSTEIAPPFTAPADVRAAREQGAADLAFALGSMSMEMAVRALADHDSEQAHKVLGRLSGTLASSDYTNPGGPANGKPSRKLLEDAARALKGDFGPLVYTARAHIPPLADARGRHVHYWDVVRLTEPWRRSIGSAPRS